MKQLQFCRLCTKLANDGNLKKLFQKSQKKWLKTIEQITGILLKKSKSLPQYICKRCQEDLEIIHAFRERCIYAQKYFDTKAFAQKSKVPTNRSNTNKDVSLPDDKVEIISELLPAANIQSAKSFLEEESIEFLQKQSTVIDNFVELNSEEFHLNDVEEIEIDENKLPLKVENRTHKKFDKCDPKPKRSLENNQTFICDQCGKNFTCKYLFLTHLRRHTGDKRFQCEICPNKFVTNSELNRHMRTHTGERPFACKHCGRRFTDYSTRMKHERTHTNERPFVCMQCSKGFTTSSMLNGHMLVHTGERSFRCEECNKTFQRQTHLVRHYKSVIHKQNVDKQEQGKSSLSGEQIGA